MARATKRKTTAKGKATTRKTTRSRSAVTKRPATVSKASGANKNSAAVQLRDILKQTLQALSDYHKATADSAKQEVQNIRAQLSKTAKAEKTIAGQLAKAIAKDSAKSTKVTKSQLAKARALQKDNKKAVVELERQLKTVEKELTSSDSEKRKYAALTKEVNKFERQWKQQEAELAKAKAEKAEATKLKAEQQRIAKLQLAKAKAEQQQAKKQKAAAKKTKRVKETTAEIAKEAVQIERNDSLPETVTEVASAAHTSPLLSDITAEVSRTSDSLKARQLSLDKDS